MELWRGMIGRYRRLRGLTQTDFAELIGVRQATVSRWEKGLSRPDLALQRKLRDLVGRPDRFSDQVIIHQTRSSIWPTSLRRLSGELVAASPTASAMQARMAKASPADQDSYTRHWERARLDGFFQAEVASIRGCGTWTPAEGGPLRYGGGVWTPVVMADGEVLLSSQFFSLARAEFELLPPARHFEMVTMDDLLDLA